MATSLQDKILEDALSIFEQRYGSKAEFAAFAPGRVNLIGEHTDYNDGFVLPFALPFKTIIVGSRSHREACRVFSCSMNEEASFVIDHTLSPGEPAWANYIKGVVHEYSHEIEDGLAFDAVVVSSVPLGSGLSSSAALEVATATFLENIFSIEHVSKVEKALRCQSAEHEFAGTPCGIMDQYISTMGEVGNLLLIDCRSQEAILIPFASDASSEKPVVVVTNSNVRHALSGSEYPDRVKQCKQAVEVLKHRYPEVQALRDATMDMLESVSMELPRQVIRRARHCVSEDARTLTAVEALKQGDFDTVGRCMLQSHVSLKEDYEVSCDELDLLTNLAMDVPGVYGSRMTGGGFGGCTVTLVKAEAVSTLRQYLQDEYKKRTNIACDVYEVTPAAGAGVVDLGYGPPPSLASFSSDRQARQRSPSAHSTGNNININNNSSSPSHFFPFSSQLGFGSSASADASNDEDDVAAGAGAGHVDMASICNVSSASCDDHGDNLHSLTNRSEFLHTLDWAIPAAAIALIVGVIVVQFYEK